MNDTVPMGQQEPGQWVQRKSSAMYYEPSPHANGRPSADVQSRRSRKMVFGGPTPKNVRRHDCLGVLRPEGPQIVHHIFQRARRPPVPRFHKASSESSLLRSPSSGLALTDVYDDTVSCRSGDRLMTRTVALRRRANLAKAKRLDDLMKARMHSSGELPVLDRSRSPLARTSTPARSLGDRSPSHNLPTKRITQPAKRDQKPAAASKPVAKAHAKPTTAQSQRIAPSESFRLFEPVKKQQQPAHNRSMPNLLHQLRPSSYSDDSIDGSVADALNAASDDSLSELDNRRHASISKSESGNLLRVEPSSKKLPSAASMPQLAVINMDLFQVQTIELTPPDSGRKHNSSKPDVLNSSQCRETQTDTSACHIDVQTEKLLSTRPALVQTDNASMNFSSVQTELSASRNLHVQTDICGAIQQVRIVPAAMLRHGGVQTEPTTNAAPVCTDRDVQTDVSCTGKSSRSKRELVLKGREIPLNELNEATLQLKHGHREITESDYFIPPQNGQLSPSLSETSSLSDRHSYMKSQSLPLHFVSNRPNIFLRKPSRANGASNATDEFDFLTSTMIGDHERNKDSKKDGNEQEGSLDSCDGSFSDGTVIDSSITDVDEPADRTNLNGFRSPSPTMMTMASHKEISSDSKNNLLTHALAHAAVTVANEASQTEVGNDCSSVTIVVNALKRKPIVRSYAYCFVDPVTYSHENEDGKSVSEASADTFSSSRTYTLERLRQRPWAPNSREYYASEYYKGAIFQLSSSEQQNDVCCPTSEGDAIADENSLVTVNARTELLVNINDKLEHDAAVEVKISNGGMQTMKMSSWNFSNANKPTVRSATGEQSTEGVHPNALKDPLNFCVVCGKRVYQLEKIAAHKGIYHKSCFRCEVCETTLRPGSFSVLEGHLFCKPHLIQQFKTRGKYETNAAFKAREASANGVHASIVQNENAAAE